MMTEGKIVPLFRRFEDLKNDEELVWADFKNEWESAYVEHDLAKATISDSHPDKLQKVIVRNPIVTKGMAALKKLSPDLAQQFEAIERSIQTMTIDHHNMIADVNRLEAEVNANNTFVSALQTAATKRDDRLFGVGEVARRSQRFAMAQSRPYYGPAATVTEIGIKR